MGLVNPELAAINRDRRDADLALVEAYEHAVAMTTAMKRLGLMAMTLGLPPLAAKVNLWRSLLRKIVLEPVSPEDETTFLEYVRGACQRLGLEVPTDA